MLPALHFHLKSLMHNIQLSESNVRKQFTLKQNTILLYIIQVNALHSRCREMQCSLMMFGAFQRIELKAFQCSVAQFAA